MKRMLLGVAVFAAFTIGLVANLPPQIAHHIIVSSVSFEYTLDELTTHADAIAVVRATGNDRVHWNNATNAKWVSDEPGGAMIYNDQEALVVDLVRGELDQMLTIRNVGGTVGDTRYELEGLAPLVQGVDYLVFLKTFETPTQEGTETAISFFGQEQGVFVANGPDFVSDHGLRVASESIRP